MIHQVLAVWGRGLQGMWVSLQAAGRLPAGRSVWVRVVSSGAVWLESMEGMGAIKHMTWPLTTMFLVPSYTAD